MKIVVTADGPAGCGKTYSLRKIAELLQTIRPNSQSVITGHTLEFTTPAPSENENHEPHP